MQLLHTATLIACVNIYFNNQRQIYLFIFKKRQFDNEPHDCSHSYVTFMTRSRGVRLSLVGKITRGYLWKSLSLLMEVFTPVAWETPGKILKLFTSPPGTRRAASSDCLNRPQANSMCVIDELHLLLNVPPPSKLHTHHTHTQSLCLDGYKWPGVWCLQAVIRKPLGACEGKTKRD